MSRHRVFRAAVAVLGTVLAAALTLCVSLSPFPSRADGLAPADAGRSVPRTTSADGEALRALHEYIHRSWSVLTRSARDLPQAARDPKFPAQQPPYPVYLSRRENIKLVADRLAQVLPREELARIQLRRLPADPSATVEPGLLYLPRPYVVPGGRFNEMYGWDSYFILLGLLRDGEVERARDLVDDAVYQAVHFGKVLNANRTYYLERSQPPLLGAMVRAVYDVTHDKDWLASTLPGLRRQHRYWTTAPHLAGRTGLSRYRAGGRGPAPEVEAGERDAQGLTHYDRVRAALKNEPAGDLEVALYYDRRHDRLTPLAYVADRSMRESGFDPSDRFGRFSLGILDYAPMCLNSLLVRAERDLASFLTELGNDTEGSTWNRRAELRARRIRDTLWDAEAGWFSDFDFVRGRRRRYPSAAAFFPLWAGVATADQARATARALLPLLSRPGGLMTSTTVSGNQWDAPYGWAPLQLAAVQGLRRYQLDEDADRNAVAFLRTVLKEFVEHGAVFEKYDVERRESDVSAGLRFGYSSNEIGFGWTNAVFLELEAGLPAAQRALITGPPLPTSPSPRSLRQPR